MNTRFQTRFVARGFLLLALALGPAPASAQAAGEFVETILGDWEGEGTLFGQPATFQLSFRKDLNDRFLHLTFRNEYTSETGTHVLDARAYYAIRESDLAGYWFDSRGVTLPVTVTIDTDASRMTSVWGDAETEQGKTMYTLRPDGRLEVADFVLQNDAYQPFGEAVYERVE